MRGWDSAGSTKLHSPWPEHTGPPTEGFREGHCSSLQSAPPKPPLHTHTRSRVLLLQHSPFPLQLLGHFMSQCVPIHGDSQTHVKVAVLHVPCRHPDRLLQVGVSQAGPIQLAAQAHLPSFPQAPCPVQIWPSAPLFRHRGVWHSLPLHQPWQAHSGLVALAGRMHSPEF